MQLIQIFEVLVILLKFAVFQPRIDPCVPSEHTKIDDKRRLPIPNENLREVLCDNRIVPGWYRFQINGADAQIPTSCVTVNNCGTQAPIWLNLRNGKIPNVGQEGFYLGCIAWSFPGQSKAECCLFRNSIRMKNCGEFFVYFLQPTQGCHMAYCAEPTGPLLNMTSNSPTSASSTYIRPFKLKLLSLPTIQPVVISEQLYLNCSFQVENADKFSIKWLKLNDKTMIRNQLESDSVVKARVVPTKMTKMYDLLAFDDNLQLDDEVVCEVEAFTNGHLNSTNNFTWSSTTFFAGLKVEPRHLNMQENDPPRTIRITSTIPLICPESSKEERCRLKLKLSTKTTDSELPFERTVALSTCDLELNAGECSTDADCGFVEFQVAAVQDFVKWKRLTKRANIDIRVDQENIEDLKWEGYVSKGVDITVLDVPSAVCRSFTDPHIITLDGRYFDFYKSGTFVLYKSINRIFEVHNRIWFCGGIPKKVSCNCGFAAREDNQFVIIDMCNGNFMETEPDIQVKVLSGDKHYADPLVKILESRQGKVISVLFPSGTYIRANVEKWGMSLTLRAPSADYNGTRGLCGIFDSNNTNDFHDNNGLDGDVVDESDFVETWRLPSGESFFDTDPMLLNVSKKEYFCDCSIHAFDANENLLQLEQKQKCSENTVIGDVPVIMNLVDITSDVLIRNEPMNDLHSTTIIKDVSNRSFEQLRKRPKIFSNSEKLKHGAESKREVIKTSERSHLTVPPLTNANLHPDFSGNTEKYFFSGDFFSSDRNDNEARKWPTEERKLEEEFVRNLCTETLLNSTIFVSCAEYLGKQVDAAIEICVTDVNLMDDPLWVTYALALLESFCQESVIEQRYLWTSNEEGIMVPPPSIVAALNCPNDCSGNGVCSDRGCECNPGYSSHDCSIFDDRFPWLTDIRGGGLCDVATTKCKIVEIIGEGFLNVNDLRCKFIPFEVLNENITLSITITEVFSKNTNHVSCVFPFTDLVSHHTTWEVMVLANGFDNGGGSMPLFFTLYNSTCFICESEAATKKPICLIKDSVCFIQGKCFMRNDINPLNSCEFCLPFENNQQWTSLAENTTDSTIINHPTLYAFDGESFSYNIEIPNSVGNTSTMNLDKKHHDAILWANGTLSWAAFSNALENRQQKRIKKFTILVKNQCNVTRKMTVEIVVRRCLCQNGGICISDNFALLGSGRYLCSCPRFFTGENCEIKASACDLNPCYLGVECFDDFTSEIGFRCGSCPKHFEGNGTVCELLDSQQCSEDNPCFAGVECRKIANETFCDDCPKGYIGNGIDCKPICKWPCRRNEICTQPNVCSCLPGYDGLRCHIAICKPFCQNGGVCVHPNICKCPSGFMGKHCEKVNCDKVCENGGRCNGKNNCLCKPGFTGKRCEITICNKKCYNGGSCVGHFGCKCALGWGGPTCQVPLCDFHCRNGALCTKSGSCLCRRGFFGSNCESGGCRPPCLNGGQCVRQNTCHCLKGWMGKYCQIPICEPWCQNGGKCWKPNKCDCPSGWSGRYCQKPICVNKCANDGMCIAPNVCACQLGYKGPFCKEAICEPKCRNGGICASPGKCLCRQPYNGLNCEQISSLQKLRESMHKIRHSKYHFRKI